MVKKASSKHDNKGVIRCIIDYMSNISYYASKMKFIMDHFIQTSKSVNLKTSISRLTRQKLK